jgi:hypothetical protein
MNQVQAYIVQKRLGYGEIPMYKEMHKITDITVKKWSIIRGMPENDIKTGHISVRVEAPRKCYQSCMKSTEPSGIFYEEIVNIINP